MNRLQYRIVFNKQRGQLMAVAETANSQSKSSGQSPARRRRRAQRAMGALGTLLLAGGVGLGSPGAVWAQIRPDASAPKNQQPTVLNTANGTPQVNIQTPSAAGVSRNSYSQFDVQTKGVVLNNARGDAATQLGGWVQGNPWLARGSARVILNEVNSGQPSQLKGFVEIAGQRAELIIANPAGIQVDGSGFINASRATLTTGAVRLGAEGGISGFDVQGGLVRIEGKGLDASQTDYTGILARAMEVNAAIHAKDLKLVTGRNVIAADHGRVQASDQQTEGNAPSFALDVAQLGGMYAGKITLVGTEAGVGVRLHGDLSASVGDVVISHNGWLSSASTIEAKQGGVSIDSAGAQSLDGSIKAAGSLSLKAGGTEQPQAIQNSGSLRAGQEVAIRGSELSNSGGLDGQRLDIEVNRLVNSGSIWQSGGQALNVQTQDLRNAQGAAMGAVQSSTSTPSSGNTLPPGPIPAPAPAPAPTVDPVPDAGASPLPSAKPLADGRVLVRDQLRNQAAATLAAAGALDLKVTQALDNAGHIRARQVQVEGDRLTMSAGTLQSDTLVASTQSVVLDSGAVSAGQVQLETTAYRQARGTQLLSRGKLNLQARDLVNAGEIRAEAQARLDVVNAMQHHGALTAAGQLSLSAGSLNSSGTLAAGMNADGSLQTFAADGAALSITSQGDVTATGKTLAAGQLTLSGAGQMNLAGSQTSAHGAELKAGGALNTDRARLITAGDLKAQAASLSNAEGTVYAGGAATVATRDALSSSGTLAAAQSLSITAGSLSSSGTLAAGMNADGSLKAFAANGAALNVTSQGDVTATGKTLAAGQLTLGGAGQ
ncbi:MAG: filamentous hemagglutinin N-terminal domain-containing protein, partial [Rubrivivax sp.]